MTSTKQALSHFCKGVPEREFRNELQCYDENQLRELHKQMKRRRIGGGTNMVVGGLAAVPSLGASLLGVGIGARRVSVNTKRIDLIEERLNKEGWKGHKVGWKDVALPVTMGAVGACIGIGIDGVVDSIGGTDSGGAPTGDIGAESSHTEAVATDIVQQNSMESITVPDIPVPPPPDVPAPPDIPNVSWTITDQGMTPMVDGVPIDGTYGQVTDSGLYQTPIDPTNAMGGSTLDWGAPPDQSGLEGMGQSDPQLEDYAHTDPGSDNFGQIGPGLEAFQQSPPGLDPFGPPDPSLNTGFDPQHSFEQQTDFAQSTIIEQQITSSYSQIGPENAIAGLAAITATHVGTHAAHHTLSSLAYTGAEHLVKETAEQAAKRAVKSIWQALETDNPIPAYERSPEFIEEWEKLIETREWKELVAYVEERARRRVAEKNKVSLDGDMVGLKPHHLDCLAVLETEGLHRRLNDPQRLKFFILQADGNVAYVRAWVSEYLEKRI